MVLGAAQYAQVVGHPTQVGLAAVACVAWIVVEYLGRRSTWRQGAPRRPSARLDRGTYPAIAVAIAVGMVATLLGFLFDLGGVLPVAVAVGGFVLLAAGLAIRAWALTSLGRFFTMPITVAPDHRIVRDGPYRWLRHPSYTGGFLTAIAIPLVLGSPAGAVVTVVACLAAYVWRIRIEEAALVSRFGASYREYATGTWRLIPGLY